MKYDFALEELKAKDIVIEEMASKFKQQKKILKFRSNENFQPQTSCTTELMENYKKFRESSTNFDVKLQFKSEKSLLAHKTILEGEWKFLLIFK
jgi:hypothetical protein